MRKWITFLMTFLVGATASYANANMGQVNFEAGYRHDNISWRQHHGGAFHTNTRFKDLDIFQIGVKARSMVGCNFYVRAAAHWGWILDGDFEQSVSTFASTGIGSAFYGSFSDDIEFTARSRDVIDDRYVYDLSAAIGYPFYFCDCTLALAPVVGYSFDEQNLRVQNDSVDFTSGGFDTSVFFPVVGSGCCWHKFTNKWYGPFVGVDFVYRPCNECWNLYAEVEYHWAQFKGKSSRSFNDEFNHRARDAHGWVFALGADYDFSNCWTLGLSLKFQDYRANRHHRHHHSSYGSDDSSFFGSGRESNKHKWDSYAINVTVGRDF
ncbi:hypothetical protein [Candidatus Protochlamydia phocaeensis]|uniref:hypothetical protein n=1 Tax=Candidatus Protochlamydia phocaeensis TaxID=1414722 RepID=UPI000838E16D|nr:hypothetical protein [Candidatus Protochlamydia phocaeensis]